MDRILDAGFKQPAAESVLIQSRSLRVDRPPSTRRSRTSSRASRSWRPSSTSARRSTPGNAGQIAKNGHAALVEFEIRGDTDKAVDKIGPVLDAVADAQRAHPELSIGEFGDASAEKGVETAYDEDLGKAGLLSLPITLIILVLTFGALVAAGIPLLLALTAVFATFGLRRALEPSCCRSRCRPRRWCS